MISGQFIAQFEDLKAELLCLRANHTRHINLLANKLDSLEMASKADEAKDTEHTTQIQAKDAELQRMTAIHAAAQLQIQELEDELRSNKTLLDDLRRRLLGR